MGNTSTMMLTKLYKLKDGSRQGLNSLQLQNTYQNQGTKRKNTLKKSERPKIIQRNISYIEGRFIIVKI